MEQDPKSFSQTRGELKQKGEDDKTF